MKAYFRSENDVQKSKMPEFLNLTDRKKNSISPLNFCADFESGPNMLT